jgi:anti-sigma B factor antagonist
MLKIERSEAGLVTVLRLEGDIDEEGVGALRLSLLSCLKEKRSKVVANLSGVRYVSFMGLGVLVERLRQLRLLGGDLKLVGVNVYTQRVFRMAGVTSVFGLYETEPLAVQGFREAA